MRTLDTTPDSDSDRRRRFRATSLTVHNRDTFYVSKQIELVQSGSQQQAESSANNRIEKFEDNGYDLVDQEIALGGNGVTILLVFASDE
jgi:hypothetical protein